MDLLHENQHPMLVFLVDRISVPRVRNNTYVSFDSVGKCGGRKSGKYLVVLFVAGIDF